MIVQVLHEAGYFPAMLGLSLSYNQDPGKMPHVADRLKFKGNGHNKFLESIAVWIDIDAPRYWWQQFDTYRCGMTKQSESTMHTILRSELTLDNFEANQFDPDFLEYLNKLRELKLFDELKKYLPESFLQRRVCCTNYRTLQTMKIQRETHKLEEWTLFLKELKDQLEYPELIWDIK